MCKKENSDAILLNQGFLFPSVEQHTFKLGGPLNIYRINGGELYKNQIVAYSSDAGNLADNANEVAYFKGIQIFRRRVETGDISIEELLEEREE